MVMGTDLTRELRSSPAIFNEPPEAPQARKLKINMPATQASTRFVRLPKPRASWAPPRMAHTRAKMLRTGAVVNIQSGSCVSDPPGVRPKVVCKPGSREREKKNQIESAINELEPPTTPFQQPFELLFTGILGTALYDRNPVK